MSEDARYVDDATFAEWEAWQRAGIEEEQRRREGRRRAAMLAAEKLLTREQAHQVRVASLLAEVDQLQAEVERLRGQVRYERWIAELATGVRP